MIGPLGDKGEKGNKGVIGSKGQEGVKGKKIVFFNRCCLYITKFENQRAKWR
jgi:hypothetical protein